MADVTGATGATGLALVAEPAAVGPPRPWRATARRFLADPLAVSAIGVLLLVVAFAVVGEWLWEYRPDQFTDDLSSTPSWAHPMGTDGLGRDLLAGVLRGSRRSLQVGLVVSAVSTALGVIIGTVAGLRSGWVDAVLMRLTDVVLSVPGIAVFAVLARSVQASGGWVGTAMILASLGWTGIARIVRALTLSLREEPYVEAARACGASDRRILFRHVLPNLAGTVVVRAGLVVGAAVLGEAALSFLGFGIRPPDTSLGLLVSAGQHAAVTRPWLFYFPGGVILVLVLAVNLAANGLRDALDPRARRGLRTPRARR